MIRNIIANMHFDILWWLFEDIGLIRDQLFDNRQRF